MPSLAASGYKMTVKKAFALRQDHASLAVCTSAWNAYVIGIINNFFSVIAEPLEPKFSAVYNIANEAAEGQLKRFNTPNSKNSRDIILQCTGYDPINDWMWYRNGRLYLNGQQTRERLNEILGVRHSFAHGFSIPAYSWTQLSNGQVRLTKTSVQEVELFFNNLVRVTDREMKAHIKLLYGTETDW